MTDLERLARRYEAAQARTDERREALYTAIQEAHAGGRTLRAIAAETSLSFGRIHQILGGR